MGEMAGQRETFSTLMKELASASDEERKLLLKLLTKEIRELNDYVEKFDDDDERESIKFYNQIPSLKDYTETYNTRSKSHFAAAIEGALSTFSFLIPSQNKFVKHSLKDYLRVTKTPEPVNKALESDMRALLRDIAKVVADKEEEILTEIKAGGYGD